MNLKNILMLSLLCLMMLCCCGKKDGAGETEEEASEDSQETAEETGTGYAFPSELIQEMASSFSKGDSILEETDVARVLDTVNKKKFAEQKKKRKLTQEEMLVIAKENGFADTEDFIQKSAETFAAYTLVSVMAEYQVMIKGYRSTKETEEAVRQIRQTKTILTVRIKRSKLTLKDMEILKKHWETWKELTDI